MARLPLPRRRSGGSNSAAVEVRQLMSRVMARLGVPSEAQEVLFAAAEVLTEEFSANFEPAGDPRTPGWRRWSPRRARDVRDQGKAVLDKIKPVLEAAESAAITTGTHWPLPMGREWAEPFVGGGTAFIVTLGEEILTLTSGGASVLAMLAATPVLQVFETYLAASVRTNAYRHYDLGYDVETVTRDIHTAVTEGSIGRSSRIGRRQLYTELLDWATERIASLFWRVMVFGLGAAWSAGGTVRLLRRVAAVSPQSTGLPTPSRVSGPGREPVAAWLRSFRHGRPDVPVLPIADRGVCVIGGPAPAGG